MDNILWCVVSSLDLAFMNLYHFFQTVEQNESPVDIMAWRAIDVFHNSVIGSQVTLNTNHALVISSSTARNDEYKISTWDGIVNWYVHLSLILLNSGTREACAHEDR